MIQPSDEQLNDLATQALVAMALDDYRADLRAQVEALRDRQPASFAGYTGRDALNDVLDLIDGAL
jgi:hypothetical protein